MSNYKITPFLRSSVGTIRYWETDTKTEIDKIRLYITQRCYQVKAKVEARTILGFESQSHEPTYILRVKLLVPASKKLEVQGRPKKIIGSKP